MKWVPSADYFRNNVAFRNDTLLGVCEALGQDLGINAAFIRVPLAAGIIFAPVMMVAIYAALGVLVFASRTFFPDRLQRLAGDRAKPALSAENEQVDLPQAA